MAQAVRTLKVCCAFWFEFRNSRHMRRVFFTSSANSFAKRLITRNANAHCSPLGWSTRQSVGALA